eukprot:gb/GECH01013469.1/.p1 GENE.gb/GECH01013469.1/~~gb/GECH01013469.1/.p1  ORF type:complete len:224 (+),score=33.99 gb/GECH01013469.1/:1-672(+)
MVITLYRPWERKYSHVAWRIRLLLEEKRLQCQTRLVVMSQNEHRSEELLRLNPRGQLPIMQDVDATLHEELAMIEYINTYYPDPPLMPPQDNRRQHADALVLTHEATDIFAHTVKKTVEYMSQTEAEITSDKIKAYKQILSKELTRWEKLLEYGSGEFLIGDTVSVADVCLLPPLAELVRWGLKLEKKFPRLRSYYLQMVGRDSVKKTWPTGWDSEPVIQWLA